MWPFQPQPPLTAAPGAGQPAIPLAGRLGGIGQGITQGLQANPNMLMALAAGLLAHRQNANNPILPAGAMMAGSQVDLQNRLLKKEQEDEQKKETATAAYLKKQGFTDEEIEAGVRNPALLGAMLKGESTEGYTLTPGARRFDAKGNLIAEGAPTGGGQRGRLVPVEGGHIYDEETGTFISGPGAVTRSEADYPANIVTPEAKRAYDANAGKEAVETNVKREGAQAYVDKVQAVIDKLDPEKNPNIDKAFGPIESHPWVRGLREATGAPIAAVQQEIEADLRSLELELRKSMKGQGPVSDYDAKVIAQRLGGLKSVDAATQKKILEGIRDELKVIASSAKTTNETRVRTYNPETGLVE